LNHKKENIMKTPVPPLPPNSLNVEFYGWDKLKNTFEDVKTLIDSEAERIDRIQTRVRVSIVSIKTSTLNQ